MGRTPCCEKVGLRKGRWTAEEDDILTKYIQAKGEGSWRSLPKNAGLLRCGKSCRLRWINYLRADLKRGNISAEEEDLIVKLHASLGNRWSLISSHMPGRTDNEIKNYWNSHLSRKVYCLRRPPTTDMDPTSKVAIPPKRRGGKTSRWAMKKNTTYTHKGTQLPKQSVTPQLNNNSEATHDQQNKNNNEAEISLSHTLSLETEALSSSTMDFLVLDPNVEDMEEIAEISCRVEDVKTTHDDKKSLLCLDGEKEIIDDMIRQYQQDEEGINGGGGALSFSDNDPMNNCVMETSRLSVSTLSSEERENNDVTISGCFKENEIHDACPDKIASSNGLTGELYSCSPIMTLALEDSCDLESVLDVNDHSDNESNAQEYKEVLTWLWEDDDSAICNTLGEIDAQRQNDMV